jgi:hypothetical protein
MNLNQTKIIIFLFLAGLMLLLNNLNIVGIATTIVFYFTAFALGSVMFIGFEKFFPRIRLPRIISIIIAVISLVIGLTSDSYISFIAIAVAGFGLDSLEKENSKNKK